MKLDFFDVDKDYIEYLQNAELDKRGFTCVPNMEYGNREQKFLCGIVLEINHFQYYVPVTSYKKQQSENVLIKIEDVTKKVVGSLRFNYMIPVPNTCICRRKINDEPRENRRIFLSKQLRYIRKISDKICSQAERTYKIIKGDFYPDIKQFACDFELLEQKCLEYEEVIDGQLNRIDELEL